MHYSKILQEKKKAKRFVILTLKCGSGHYNAGKAKIQEIKDHFPHAEIFEQDLLIDWFSRPFGKLFTYLWNSAQVKGNILSISFFGSVEGLCDILISPLIFISALIYLWKYDIDWIVDTQILGTSSVLKAIRLLDRWKGKKIILEKVVTDLPCEDATHFFRPIKKLSLRDHPYLRLVTTHPLLKKNETEIAFWKKHCNLPLNHVVYDPFPLRKSFLQEDNVPHKRKTPIHISFVITDEIQKKIIEELSSYSTLLLEKTAEGFSFKLLPEEKVTVITLGSNSQNDAILHYLKNFIEMKHLVPLRKDRLIIFCNDPITKGLNLYKAILDTIKTHKTLPSHLHILPLPLQEAEIVAPLFRLCDAIITRSGGLTSMELLSICHGKIWIHKELKKSRFPFSLIQNKTIKEGMPFWERGNADYLIQKKGAMFITPDTFPSVSHDFFLK